MKVNIFFKHPLQINVYIFFQKMVILRKNHLIKYDKFHNNDFPINNYNELHVHQIV